MKLRTMSNGWAAAAARAAFSLMEVMVCVSIVGVMFVGLYASLSSGFATIELARENLRAGQILQEKMETLRLYTWDQINAAGFIPSNFTESFFTGTQSTSGLTYTGVVTLAAAPIAESYSADLKQVTVEVAWVSAKVPRKREMSTFVSKYGLQKYIY